MLHRLAGPDARHIGDSLAACGVKLSLGGATYDPAHPREGMAVARAKGKRPDLMEVFSVGRAAVYRVLERARSVIATR